tara:strand:+ start:21669 stop:22592 length:924 start_codon:yes stop_codon:yes gene_type:complete
MKISVRMEGGLGDHLLANRFVPAILDKYPGAEIHLFSDTGGKSLQSDTLLSLYDFYSSRTLLKRQSDEYRISSQFGSENFAAHINNTDPEQKAQMLNYDKFYNLHLDWMEWIYYDFHWQNYFYHFPKPSLKILPYNANNSYVVLHLASDNMGNNHRMSKSYINKIISNIPPLFDIKILSTPSTEDFIRDNIEEQGHVEIVSDSLPTIISMIKSSSGLLAIDSGIKYFGYMFNIPTLSWAKECKDPHICPLAFQTRWLTFPQLYYPLEYDAEKMVEALMNLIKSNNFFLNPNLEGKNLDRHVIRRVEK